MAALCVPGAACEVLAIVEKSRSLEWLAGAGAREAFRSGRKTRLEDLEWGKARSTCLLLCP